MPPPVRNTFLDVPEEEQRRIMNNPYWTMTDEERRVEDEYWEQRFDERAILQYAAEDTYWNTEFREFTLNFEKPKFIVELQRGEFVHRFLVSCDYMTPVHANDLRGYLQWQLLEARHAFQASLRRGGTSRFKRILSGI